MSNPSNLYATPTSAERREEYEREVRIGDLLAEIKALETIKQAIDFARTAVNAAEANYVTFDRYSRLREALDEAEAAVLEEIGPRADQVQAYIDGERV